MSRYLCYCASNRKLFKIETELHAFNIPGLGAQPRPLTTLALSTRLWNVNVQAITITFPHFLNSIVPYLYICTLFLNRDFFSLSMRCS